jgi:hypothetical protein
MLSLDEVAVWTQRLATLQDRGATGRGKRVHD